EALQRPEEPLRRELHRQPLDEPRRGPDRAPERGSRGEPRRPGSDGSRRGDVPASGTPALRPPHSRAGDPAGAARGRVDRTGRRGGRPSARARAPDGGARRGGARARRGPGQARRDGWRGRGDGRSRRGARRRPRAEGRGRANDVRRPVPRRLGGATESHRRDGRRHEQAPVLRSRNGDRDPRRREESRPWQALRVVALPPAVLGNGSLLATVSARGRVQRLGWPHRDREQLLDELRLGVEVDGSTRWLDDEPFAWEQSYADGAMVLRTTAWAHGVEVQVEDLVHPT